MTAEITLNKQQRQRLTLHLRAFQDYVKTQEFQKDQAHRLEHVHFFQEELPKRLSQFSEADLNEIVTKLWASRIWGTKQYHVQRIVEDNGLDKLRVELTDLLRG